MAEVSADNVELVPTTAIEESGLLEVAPLLRCIPNPADGGAVVHYEPGRNGTTALVLYDLAGRPVWNQAASADGRTRIETGSLSEGVYLLEARGAINSHQKIVVRH